MSWRHLMVPDNEDMDKLFGLDGDICDTRYDHYCIGGSSLFGMVLNDKLDILTYPEKFISIVDYQT